MPIFKHSGYNGDIIYSLRATKELGGGNYYVDYETSYLGSKESLGEERSKALADLISTQKYIKKAGICGRYKKSDFDFDRFRIFSPKRLFFQHLALTHWMACGRCDDIDLTQKWFTIDPIKKAEIVICRSDRRWSKDFAWKKLEPYKERCLFLGHKREWKRFCGSCFKVPNYEVNNLVEFAQIIAGCKLFVGNQSFGFSLAEAMKVNRILEVFEESPNCKPQTLNGHMVLHDKFLRKYLK